MVGIPVSGIAAAAQREGIRYYGMRHEMPATYAGQATGYLNGRIGVSLVVSGPGALNAVGAFANAWSNRWPLLMIGGASDSTRADMGDFQEAEQVAAMSPYAKYARRAESTERLPLYVAEAVRKAINGTPGPSYLDLPGNLIFNEVDEDTVEWAPRVPDPPRLRADDSAVEAAIAALKTAEQPLIVIGKGISFGRAEAEMRRFVEQTGIPYLAMPMARGVLPDDHPAVDRGGAQLRAEEHGPRLPRQRAPQLDAATSASRRVGARMCASSNSTRTPRRSASTCPPRSASSATRR